MISLDFETYLISEEEGQFPKPVCLSYYTKDVEDVVVGHEAMEEALKWALGTGKELIAHNATFEAGVIFTHFPNLREQLKIAIQEQRFICTKIYEQLSDNLREKAGFQYSLAALVLKYFDEDLSGEKTDPDAWRLRYSELDGIPKEEWPERAIKYSLDDSIWAHKLIQVQRENFDINIRDSVEAEIWLNLMANTGMTVNVDRVQQLEDEIYAKLEPNYQVLEAKGLVTRIKGTKRVRKSAKGFREHIKAVVPEPKKTPKGNIATSGNDLQDYYAQVKDDTIGAYLEVMKYEKVVSAFTRNLKSPLIRTSYSATKTTGRTSSSKSRNMPSVNIQQMPRSVKGVTWDVRNCFVPREGYAFVSIDYAGLELASVAHQLYVTFGTSAMRDLLNSGEKPTDMHSRLAAVIMSGDVGRKVSYAEFVENKKKEPYAHYRQLAKPINLGFPGGIGYDTMRFLLSLDEITPKFLILEKSKNEQYLRRLRDRTKKETCRDIRIQRVGKFEWALVYDELVKLKNDLFELYPELHKFLTEEHNNYTTGEKKWMKNDFSEWEEEPMYRYDLYGFSRDYATYTAFCNGYLMQSPSAIGAKRAMCAIINKYIDHPDMNPLAFIHDEIVFEVKPDRKDIVEDVSNILIEEMQKVLSSVRITVEAEMMDYWSKSGGYWSKEYWRDAQ